MKLKSVKVGVIGCGVISDAYFTGAKQFPVLEIVACADVIWEAASRKADDYKIVALSVDDLLADQSIEIVLNLTTPQYHAEIGLKALAADKHVYSEKPLALGLEEAMQMVELASSKKLRIGCAPDTFFGAAHQTARKAIDENRIGKIIAGTAFMMVGGHEQWHPNPDFYYQAGGGPLFDMGPYYLTALVNMIGPIECVNGMAKSSFDTRVIASGDREGEHIPVETDTHISSIVKFVSGATVTLTMSFDVKKHAHSPIELYGTAGSLLVSDPNYFEGVIKASSNDDDWQDVEQQHLYGDGDYRGIGLADMATAIRSDRPHRASLDLSLHVLEAMEAILTSAEKGSTVHLQQSCGRPQALPLGLSQGHLD